MSVGAGRNGSVPDYYAITRETSTPRDGAGAVAHLRLSGSLDIGAREDLTEAIGDAVGEECAEIVVDLADVTFLDSEALAGLIVGCTNARRRGVGFRVSRVHGIVHRVLTVTGTLPILTLPEPRRPAKS